LSVFQCAKVNVTKIHYDFKIGENCYDTLPVTLSDKTAWFAPSGSHNLVKNGNVINCNERPVFIWKDQNSFVSINGLQPVVHTDFGHLGRGYKGETKLILSAPPIITDLHFIYEAKFRSLTQLSHSLYQVRMELSELVQSTSELHVQPQQLMNRIKRATEKTANAITDTLSHAYENVEETADTWISAKLNKFVFGPTQFVINSIFIGILCCAGLYLVIVCLRSDKCRKWILTAAACICCPCCARYILRYITRCTINNSKTKRKLSDTKIESQPKNTKPSRINKTFYTRSRAQSVVLTDPKACSASIKKNVHTSVCTLPQCTVANKRSRSVPPQRNSMTFPPEHGIYLNDDTSKLCIDRFMDESEDFFQ
jgi:hypothetical protein